LEDAVSDYVPQFTNLIVLDDIMKEEPSYAPAKEIVRIKHLLNFTSGFHYPFKDVHPGKQLIQYSSPHNKDDPIGEFFRLAKVCSSFFFAKSDNLTGKCRDPCQEFRSSLSPALNVGCFPRS
jgi:hypothetical protein